MNAQEVIAKLQQIASKNNDRFKYTVDIQPRPGGLLFVFTCSEKAEGHTFVSGTASTLDEAANAAATGIDEALEQWDYKKP